jgi:periplasmic copper chaperone A
MTRFQRLALALVVAASAASALAEDFKAGDISIQKPWARATPKGADVGVAYFVIRNTGAKADRLTGGKADFGTVEIHEMKSEDGVMKMQELTTGLNIPAHGSIGLAPGGYHLMFTHLTHPLNKGDNVKATLTFEHAGPIEVTFPVVGIGASAPGAAKGGDMGGMKM